MTPEPSTWSIGVHRCDMCGKPFGLSSKRNLQEVFDYGDWRLVCIPCLEGTELEAGK